MHHERPQRSVWNVAITALAVLAMITMASGFLAKRDTALTNGSGSSGVAAGVAKS